MRQGKTRQCRSAAVGLLMACLAMPLLSAPALADEVAGQEIDGLEWYKGSLPAKGSWNDASFRLPTAHELGRLAETKKACTPAQVTAGGVCGWLSSNLPDGTYLTNDATYDPSKDPGEKWRVVTVKLDQGAVTIGSLGKNSARELLWVRPKGEA